MKSAVIRTSTEKVIEMASEKSSRKAGRGRMSTTMIAMTPSARARSPRLERSVITLPGVIPEMPRLPNNPFGGGALVASLIQ